MANSRWKANKIMKIKINTTSRKMLIDKMVDVFTICYELFATSKPNEVRFNGSY